MVCDTVVSPVGTQFTDDGLPQVTIGNWCNDCHWNYRIVNSG